MTEENEIKGKFRYDQNSKRFHRFQIETDAGVVGIVYVPKKIAAMPKKIVLEYANRN